MSVALVIQHAKRMRCVILSSMPCPAVQYFSTLSHKRHDFRGGGGGGNEHKKRVFFLSLQILSETFLILKRIQRDTITNVRGSSCKIPVILVRF